jgi:hypothetical protein
VSGPADVGACTCPIRTTPLPAPATTACPPPAAAAACPQLERVMIKNKLILEHLCKLSRQR